MSETTKYILFAHIMDLLSKLLLIVGALLLSWLFMSGVTNLLRGIPYTTDTIASVEQHNCTNVGMNWTAYWVTTEKGYVFYDYSSEDTPLPGDEIFMSFWEARMGFFHMGTCLPINDQGE